ncbi:MAG: tryptophan synthase subunit alpha [Candidatus Omnitrophota bacterium]
MTNRIEQKFHQLRREGKKAFIPFITAGDPDLETTRRLALEFDRLGADILELGVPFSDPLADGPTIQAASQRALENKVKVKDVFHLVKKIRERTDIPLVLLTYYNLISRLGPQKFAAQAKQAGADGIIVPDLPMEEAGELCKAAQENDLAVIFLLAPTSDSRRIKKIASLSGGFIYYVSLTGTTGARQSLPQGLTDKLGQIKKITTKPVCVGFGVSSPAQAKQIAKIADGVIVGSAIIKIIEKNLGRGDLVENTVRFVRTLREAVQ